MWTNAQRDGQYFALQSLADAHYLTAVQ